MVGAFQGSLMFYGGCEAKFSKILAQSASPPPDGVKTIFWKDGKIVRPRISRGGSAATEVLPANHANEREYESARSAGSTTAQIRELGGTPSL